MTPRRRRPSAPAIIPPIVLDEIEARGDEAAKVAARRTKALSLAIRVKREAAVEPQEGERREVYSADNGTHLPGRQVRGEDAPESGDEDVDSAYDGLGHTWAYLHGVENRHSLDDQGMTLLASVHYDRSFDNAFWDGAQMVFGDGYVFGSFARSLSVVAHELGHGVVQYTAQLIYRNQPGALNEHWADVIGTLVEQRARGQTAADADWLIGRELFQGALQGRALRSMIEPGTAYNDPLIGSDPQPDHMSRYVTTNQDEGGVHINSGIPNRAFALACRQRGGYAWEEVGRVWYHALLHTLPKHRPQFGDAAQATFASAVALYGTGSLAEQAVRAGWSQVGIAVDDTLPAPPRKRYPCDFLFGVQAFIDEVLGDADAVALLQQLATRRSVQRGMVRMTRALRGDKETDP